MSLDFVVSYFLVGFLSSGHWTEAKSHIFCIRFYVAVEVEPYENGGGRVIEERETGSGWERESREKNINISGIRYRYGML